MIWKVRALPRVLDLLWSSIPDAWCLLEFSKYTYRDRSFWSQEQSFASLQVHLVLVKEEEDSNM